MEPNLVDEIRTATRASLERIEDHWFIRDAHLGRLSAEQSIRWVKCAGRESRSFPDILEGMIAKTTQPIVRKILEENLADEYGNGNPEQAHFKHYVHLLGKIGISPNEFESYEEKDGIKLALSLAYNIAAQDNAGVALGYMLVNEGMTPITYGAADIALHKYFPDLKTSFFTLHVEVDAVHVEELYKAIAAMPNESAADILFGVAIGERGMAVLLDEAFGVFDAVESTESRLIA